MSQTKSHFVMSVDRFGYNQCVAHMLNAASRYGVDLAYKTSKGIFYREILWVVEGEEAHIAQFYDWVHEFARLNRPGL